MKKLMIAAAVAAMTAGAFAEDKTPCERDTPVVETARIYQIQMNVYTTRGVAQGLSGVGGTQCDRGTDVCVVRRGKDKTVFRGYIYTCEMGCDLAAYSAALADVKRLAPFEIVGEPVAPASPYDLKTAFVWDFMNIIGANNSDAETAWTFGGTKEEPTAQIIYDYKDEEGVKVANRFQYYWLRGAGYGQFNKSSKFFDSFKGYFAGTASASYDLSSKLTEANADCICQPSQVLTCSTVSGVTYVDSATVAFGTWKMKFNANVTKKYYDGTWNPIEAVLKMLNM